MLPMNILVTVDERYISPLKTMLTSLKRHATTPVKVWLIHRQLSADILAALASFITTQLGFEFQAIQADAESLGDVPVTDQYPVETYYRLLCGEILPKAVHRVLYLDPDTLILNALDDLWRLPLTGKTFAAVAHQGDQNSRERLGLTQPYFNTGVLLIDLDRLRQLVDIQAINQFVAAHDALPLVDQDVLNGLYGDQVVEVDDRLWNLDVPNFLQYEAAGITEDWVKVHTKVLHYQRQPKPWQSSYQGPLATIYHANQD